ncbi:hypothetical protein CTA2_8560, partial [Colletotrichum tanaceti]
YYIIEKLHNSISNLIAAVKPIEIRPRLIRDFLQESESFNQDLAQYKWLDISYYTRLLYRLTLSLHVTAQEKLQPVPTITQQRLLKFRGKILTYVADDLLYLQHQIRHLSSLSAPTLHQSMKPGASYANGTIGDENPGQLTHCIFDAGLHPTSSNPEVWELRKDFLSKVAPPRSAE